MANFGDTERYIKGLFVPGERFVHQGHGYTVLQCGKPTPAKGECKTDIYVETKDEDCNKKEFKISIKKGNADFLENKIKLERAIEILGEDAQEIIKNSILVIRQAFENDFLIYFERGNHTEALCVKMGWKFELLNKLGGEKTGQIVLTEDQKMNIYAGTGLSLDKKNSKVNGKVIVDSGIANYIITVDEDNKSLDYYLGYMLPIEEFVKSQNIYFACKALNYRVNCEKKKKWDGNRPLAVYIDWSLNEGKLFTKFIFDKPLSVEGDEIGTNLNKILSELKITKDNFDDLRLLLSAGIKVFK